MTWFGAAEVGIAAQSGPLDWATGEPLDLFCALLFTDVEESTELWEHFPDAMDRAIREHYDLLVSLIHRHDGRLITTTGDGVFAIFPTAIAAVMAAIEAQQAFNESAWPDVGSLRVRMGVHVGLCRTHLGEVYGRPVNLAARVEQAAHGGQILLSDAVAHQCRAAVPADVSLPELGRYRLRGFDDAITLHQVVAGGLRSDFPPLRTVAHGYDEVPIELTPLIGRDALIAEVSELLRNERLVTLWGPAGVGKSRVAIRLAHRARRPFIDGVRFVDLTTLRLSRDVPDAVLSVLRGQKVGDESPLDCVVRVVRSARLLLILDNCEHVLDGALRLVERLLSDCPGVHVLTTSQERLGVRSERRIGVEPLALPSRVDDSLSADVDALRRFDAIVLFEESAKAVDSSFGLSSINAGAVVKLCRALDGLPLAIELAAARLEVEGIDDLVRPDTGLTERLEVANRPGDRNSSVLRSLDFSIHRLDPAERSFLAHLSVFAGAFTRDMAMALIDLPGISQSYRALDRLARASLIVRDGADPERFKLLEVTRAYANRLLSDAEGRVTESQHAHLMLARAEQLGPLIHTAEEAKTVRTMRTEFSDYRIAMRWFIDQWATESAARLLVALYQFGHFQLLSELHDWAANLAEHVPPTSSLAPEVFGAAALSAWFVGDNARAITLGDRAVASARGDRPDQLMWARLALIDALSYSGRLAEVGGHFRSFTEECRASHDDFWRVTGLGYEAISWIMFGRIESAIEKAEEAIRLARRLGNPDCLHWALHCLGRALAPQDPATATAAFAEAMDCARRADSRWCLSLDMIEWIRLQRQADQLDDALVGLLELVDLLVASGNRSQLSGFFAEVAHVLSAAHADEAAALVWLGRDGLPEMPRAMGPTDGSDNVVDELQRRLGNSWTRVTAHALAMSEVDLTELCKVELQQLLWTR